MYMPALFEQTDPAAIADLVAEHPLGALVTLGPEGLVADHIPFLLRPGESTEFALVGHVARNNALWQVPSGERDVLVIFQGPTAYITPNWYQTKAETHQVVPTYNYLVVHVHGRLVIHDEPKWIRAVVGRLTQAMESSNVSPWKMGDAPAAFVEDQLTRVVGIEIPISRIEAKWKASQNRPIADQAGVVAGLGERNRAGDPAMRDTIRKRLEVVQPG